MLDRFRQVNVLNSKFLEDRSGRGIGLRVLLIIVAVLLTIMGANSVLAGSGQSTPAADPPGIAHQDVRAIEARAHDFMAQDPPDWAAARDAFEQAAALGSLRARSYLGWMYEQGHGVDRDHAEAARWYSAVAEAGVHEYAVKLGWMYMGGGQLALDREKAESWFNQGIAGGYLPANVALASVLVADAQGGQAVERVFEARRLLDEAMAGDLRVAALFLARLYVEGVGGHPVDEALGAHYTRISAEDGHPQMQGWLARMYLEGTGVPVDLQEAAFWAALAASGDDPVGRELHRSIGTRLSDDERKAVLERTIRWAFERQIAAGAGTASSPIR